MPKPSKSESPRPKRQSSTPLEQLPGSGYVRERQLVGGILPFSASTLWRMVREDRFPRPVKISPRIKAWPVEAVREWMRGIEGR